MITPFLLSLLGAFTSTSLSDISDSRYETLLLESLFFFNNDFKIFSPLEGEPIEMLRFIGFLSFELDPN